jgi:hypothetical protein
MDDEAEKVYVTKIPVYTHPLLDEHMVLGDSRFFVDLEVPHRQIASGYRGTSKSVFRCVMPHWHIITPLQDTPLTVYVVDGCLAIKWTSVVSPVLDVMLELMPGTMRELTHKQMCTPVMEQLDADELRQVVERMEMAFLATLLGDIDKDDN